MKLFATGIALSLLAFGCGGSGSKQSSDASEAISTMIASLQGLGAGEAVYSAYSNISNEEASAPNHIPPTNTLFPLGYDGLYYEFSSFSVNLNGTVTAGLVFFSDGAGQDQVGTGTLTATVSGTTTTVQLSVAMTTGPLPVSGSALVTVVSGQVTSIGGTLTNQASRSSVTFNYNLSSGTYTLTDTYRNFTLSSTGTVTQSVGGGINISGNFTSSPSGPSGSFTENQDGSGSITLTTAGVGLVTATWNAAQTLAFTLPGGATTTITQASSAAL